VTLPKTQHRLWTVSLNTEKSERTPIVLVHGMGGGVGLWVQNMDELAKNRPLHAFDLLGFGRSSRPNFSKNAHTVETEFVDSIEEWRQEMNLDKFILVGHSLGAFLASSYSIKHPERVKHLVLVDPWGFQEKMANRASTLPSWIRVILKLAQPFNPLAGLRAAGPLGKATCLYSRAPR
jgi:pimeloyl-ACP methyl ester carboxylesterase